MGVQDTLKGIARLVLVNLTRRYQPKTSAPEKAAAAPVPAAAEPMAAAPAAKPSAPKHAPVEAPRPVASVPLSPVASAPKPNTAPTPVLVGAASAPAASRDGAASAFGEVDIDEMIGGLRESDAPGGFGADDSWAEPTGEIPTPGQGFDDDRDGGFFGEAEAEPSARHEISPALLSERFADAAPAIPRLKVGEVREVVVPVELNDGNRVKRFRLSVTLRLDPAD